MATPTSMTIVDAKKSVVLTVKQGDIDKADRKDSKRCVLAVAAKRQLGADEVRIHLSRAYIRLGERWTRYLMDERATRELVVFDRGAAFEPGEYMLRKVHPAQRLGQRQGSSAPDKKGSSKREPGVQLHGTSNVRKEMVSDIYAELRA